MKKNYILSLFLMILFTSGILAQNAKTYNPDNAYQKTIKLENTTSKEVAISEFGKNYNLDENNTFVEKKETSDFSGFTHQRYQQYYKGIKVEFGTAITHARNGQVESVNGELYDAKNLDIKPTLSQQDCFNRALNFIGAQKYLWEDDNSARAMDYVKPVGELVIFPKINVAEIRLAYKYDIYAMTPLSRNEIFVDAHTGEILYKNPIIKHLTKLTSNKEIDANAKKGEAIILENNTNTYFLTGTAATRYSGTKSIETKLVGANYILQEDTRGTGNGTATYNSGKAPSYALVDFVNSTNTWTTGNYAAASATKDNAALDAHWGAEMTHDFWKNIFGRNSYDDAGAKIKSYVHYDDVAGGAGYSNAFWNGNVMTYGDGSTRPFTALDVCGHEIGHAICTYTCDLAYQNQSGGMNEGLSDIWGACIEQYGRNGNLNATADTASPGTLGLWKVGEDLSSTASALRSMSYPTTKGDPDTYLGTNWSATADDGSCAPTSGNDHCGVHTNSGVLNHWFYLLTIGKTNWTNNATPTRTTTTTGIGMAKSSQITYFAERDYLTSNATYSDMRNATIEVAKNVYGCGSTEYIAVMDAWYAVNVGAKYSGLDLVVSSVTGDSNVACGASHSVSFILKNQGSQDIISSSTTISYSIDGGTSTNVNWLGNSLSACTNPSQNYSITIGALSRGTHSITVLTTVTGDTDTTNNTKTTLITVNDNGTVGTINPFTTAANTLVSIDGNGDTNSIWERGAVNKSPLTTTATGSSSGYATKLVGNYPDNSESYLVSQCYDLSTYNNATVSFDMAFDLEENYDFINLEFSTDSGTTWKILGSAADSNWYNSSRTNTSSGTTNDCQLCPGKQWTGAYATGPTVALGGTGINGNKRNYTHTLTASDLARGITSGPSNIIFRFKFVSDGGANQTGVFIDNFVVQGTLSTQENQFENFGVYPNPSNGLFNVVLSTSDKVNITLHDLRGRSIYNETFLSNGSVFSKELNFSSLSSGIYMLNVESEGKKASKKIIIN
ncbi:MAG: M4 family metallopeptidase [Flavobacterium sp.]|uniref:M4 family metallopeptidase n=1 Tax=Flavobacterium sp. TaxID=239 RepID=UPI003263717B